MTSQGEDPDATEASLPATTGSTPTSPNSQTPAAPAPVPPLQVESPQRATGNVTSRDFEKVDGPARGKGRVTPTREAARLQVALRLIWVLAGTIAILAVLLATTRWTKLTPSDTTTTFNTIITAVVTLIASAVGFYFGSENKKGNNDTTDGDDKE